jgi:curved DNA-binding protein CbpA
VNDQVYQAVLNFYRTSIRDDRLLDAASPMPSQLSRMLKAAAELTDKQPPAGDPGLGEALRLAVTQFAERILFIDQANYYRILGLNRNADTVQIKDHYRWLSRLLFPVGDVVHWNEADGALLNRAYSVLRDPKFRKAYDDEFLSKGGIDNTVGVKREAAKTDIQDFIKEVNESLAEADEFIKSFALADSGQGAVAKAVASVPGQARFPAEGGFTPEQASAPPDKETDGSSFIAAKIRRINQTPFTRVETARRPTDSMSAASVSPGPAPTAIPVTDGSVFPSPAKAVEAVHRSWGSLAVKIGVPIAVGLGVLVYLSNVSPPFIDDRAENRPLPVTINPPAAPETGQVIARSEPPVQGPAAGDGGGHGTAVKPSHDAVSDLHASTHIPAISSAGGGPSDLVAVPDKQSAQVAATLPPDALPPGPLPVTINPPAVAGTGQVIARSEPPMPGLAAGDGGGDDIAVEPSHDAVSDLHAGTHKPTTTTTAGGGPGLAAVRHKQAAPVAATPAPAREIRPAPLANAPHSSGVAKREDTATPKQHTAITAQAPPPAREKFPERPESVSAPAREVQAETVHIAQGPKPVASSALPSSPAKSAGEQPLSPSTDSSGHPGIGTGISQAAAAVQPPPSGDKLAMAAAQMLPSPLPGDTSSTSQSKPASPLQAVNEQHLESLIKSFISSYEAGDLDIFMSLFSEDVHTKSQKDRESIRTAYDQFFQATRNRRLRLQGLKWTHADKATVVGRAPFLLTLNQEGKRNPLQYRGTLIFHVENRSPHLLITQFDYQYQENKN